MITLTEYLQDIAQAILKPLHMWYRTEGGTMEGYCGLHKHNATDDMWQPWTKITSIEITDTLPAEDAGTYILYYIHEDNRQCSWWAKV